MALPCLTSIRLRYFFLRMRRPSFSSRSSCKAESLTTCFGIRLRSTSFFIGTPPQLKDRSLTLGIEPDRGAAHVQDSLNVRDRPVERLARFADEALDAFAL